MKSGEDYVVLAKSKTPINPNEGDERFVHHAFGVALDKYEESRAYLEEKGVHIIHEEERVDGVFPGGPVLGRGPVLGGKGARRTERPGGNPGRAL